MIVRVQSRTLEHIRTQEHARRAGIERNPVDVAPVGHRAELVLRELRIVDPLASRSTNAPG